ncbi:carboxyl transferase domain-containing protein [Streptomyces sp. NBC_00829]|uniref:carboxyl transferase domain-containing protein n=1 Tax=Streptomyces sp. NBC_00829 TaxID=2903679 RepID=UPI00386EDFB7|nr:acetyl-CoA carboxylase carboxyltransferase subunit alpha/beta [Streptomyces sp. NBC_00829]
MTRRQPTGAHALLAQVLDPGSWISWDTPPHLPAGVDEPYAGQLRRAAARSGTDEAVVTGEGLVHGRRVAVIACEFAFLGGSFGAAASARLVAAVERATAARLPLLASPASGGTRMQEGTAAFVQMVRITAVVAAHRAAGLAYLVYLRGPTAGGALASWGSLGQITAAEPGALIGFLGPRAHEALCEEPLPPDVQRAENLHAHGLVDAVLEPAALRDTTARVLALLAAPRPGPDTPARPDPEPLPAPEAPPDLTALRRTPASESLRRSRRPERPGVRALLRHGAHEVVRLHGTGEGETDARVLLALARFGDTPCVVLGQDRDRQDSCGPFGPAALRVARRGMRLAAELRLPLVSVVDTAGAALSREAEEGGLAGAIARCLTELVTLRTPTLSLLLGQGAGGGALALLPADRVLCAQYAWLAPLPPEGASAIVHRSAAHAPAMAEALGVRAVDLLDTGVVDRIVAERPDAAEEAEDFCRRAGRAVADELRGLSGRPPDARRTARVDRTPGGERTFDDRRPGTIRQEHRRPMAGDAHDSLSNRP